MQTIHGLRLKINTIEPNVNKYQGKCYLTLTVKEKAENAF